MNCLSPFYDQESCILEKYGSMLARKSLIFLKKCERNWVWSLQL